MSRKPGKPAARPGGKLALLCRVLLGAVFLYASLFKIADPPNFAKEIWGYKLLPAAVVNLFALWLPWLELLVGLALLVGVWVRSAGALAGGMLLLFIGAIGLRMLREGTDFECGCFPTTPGLLDAIPVVAQVKAFLLTSKNAVVTLLRDLFLLALAGVAVARPTGWAPLGAGRPGSRAEAA